MVNLIPIRPLRDPHGEVTAKTAAMLLAGLMAASLWFVWRFPCGNIMMVLGAAFSVMAAYSLPRWKNKLTVIAAIAILGGGLQFVIAMLLHERWLLLGWLFVFSLLLFHYWNNRPAASIVLAVGGLGIAMPAGYQPGLDRLIAQLWAGGCAIVAIAMLEMTLTPWRIRLILRQYLPALGRNLQSANDGDNPSVPENLSILTHARKANQLLAGQRLLTRKLNAMALRAQPVLERLHVISRALILLRSASREERVAQQDRLAMLPEALVAVAEQIRRGEFIHPTTMPPPETFDDTDTAGRAGELIARELMALTGYRPGGGR